MTRRTTHARRAARALRLLGLLTATVAVGCLDQTPDEPAASDAPRDDGMQIPVDFVPACAPLTRASAPPADLTIDDFFGCLTDASWGALDALYRAEVARRGGDGPTTLAELVARFGHVRLAGASLRALAFGEADEDKLLDVSGEGVAPERTLRYAFPTQYGLDPSKCDKSCIVKTVDLVGGRRKVGFVSAHRGAEPLKDTKKKRYLDEIRPGTFPDLRQKDLKNDELKSTGCGPTSAINLYEWWGIPVFRGSTELTTFDARAEFIADRMDTLDGVNFTDDDELIDFVTTFPKEMFEAGRIPGYPAYHYMRGDPEAWKVMMSYLARGYPVITLYSTSSSSLHWALVTGVQGGKALIANASDRTLADLFAQWKDWDDLDWYNDVGATLFVEKSTMVALTGWGTSKPRPERFAKRTQGGTLPGYNTSSASHLFRYCVGGTDAIGTEAEDIAVAHWSGEPSGALPGYCMFVHPFAKLVLEPSPAGGAASSKKDKSLTLSVKNVDPYKAFVSAQPGVRCVWHGLEAGAWKVLADKRCAESGARSFTFTNDGRYTKVSLVVHAPDLARATWTITVTN